MYNFKNSPERNHSYFGQTPWLGQYYNQVFQGKTDGYLVEIGVGHTFDWNLMTRTYGGPRKLNENEKFVRGESTTIELIEHGWSGLYIEPIEEFLTLELLPLVESIIGKQNIHRIKTAAYAASDVDGFTSINSDQALIHNVAQKKDEVINFYNYSNRVIEKRNTTKILQENNCPNFVDMLSVDVEGHEINVLKGIDFTKYDFKMILVEIDKTPLNNILQILPNNFETLYADGLNALLIQK